jgi:hypothetical protein
VSAKPSALIDTGVICGGEKIPNLEKRAMKRICLTTALIIATGRLLLAQEIALAPAREIKPAAEEKDAGSSSYVIFSNLGSPGDLFNSTSFDARPLAGSKVQNETEEWQAVRFVPGYDVQVTTLEAAIGYTSGTRIVTFALYNDDPTFHYPGTALPGSQVDATDIPDLGDCCQLQKFRCLAMG